jgi:hypothetical protein
MILYYGKKMWHRITILIQGNFLPKKVGKAGQVRQRYKYQMVIKLNF